MKSLLSTLREKLSDALVASFGNELRDADPQIKPSGDPKFGDYQSNAAMSLARKIGTNPRDFANKVVVQLSTLGGAMFEKVEVAGPGFINLKLSREFLASQLGAVPAEPASPADDRLGIDALPDSRRETVVIDYSSPNVAKQMHVGHLRTTVIGDVIARVLTFQGHRVIRQNHLGDWGTQFGMVILGMWHAAMAHHRGEAPGYLVRALDSLRRAIDAGPDALNAHLQTLADRASADLMADPDGTRIFEPFLEQCRTSALLSLPDIEAGYIYINSLSKAAAGTPHAARFADPRSVAAMMQRGDAQERLARQIAIQITLAECNQIYRRLGVLLEDADVRGESFYEPLLAPVIEEIRLALSPESAATDGDVRAVCREDKGALCIFLESADGAPLFKGPQGDPLPMIIRKSDGATLYATTDLAAALYRCANPVKHPVSLRNRELADTLAAQPFQGGLGADRVIYHVGAPQKLHFEMLFAAVHVLGWSRKPDGARSRLEHVSFGSVLGDDRKMLRTRSGDSIKLRDLLSEAVDRAEAQLRLTESDPQRRRGFADAEIRDIAEVIGIAAVKYADLCQNRNTDYVFSWDKMMALQGNTAPYLLYAYARIRSIYRKGAEELAAGDAASAEILLAEQEERNLALALLRFGDVIDSVGDNLMPNYLCEYLYETAGRFMAFYETCPVLKAPSPAIAQSRLRLCDLTARTLRIGLGLMGIPVLDRM